MGFLPTLPDVDFAGPTSDFFSNSPSSLRGFSANAPPSVSGLGTRQSRLPNNRVATSTRHIMQWFIPEGPIVQMYINPQNVAYNYEKNITEQRTKGGFVFQYWGPGLHKLSISGTTGTSGIEGINVLYDIYNNEQLAFDPYALALASKKQQDLFGAGVFGSESALNSGLDFASSLFGSGTSSSPYQNVTPTLASLAFTVELYWSGEVYRGFFSNFSVTESASELGLFNYQINFTATQKRGFRTNFLAWHRSATSGPINSDPLTGTPYSYGALLEK